jgi:hypothetical protein
LKIGQQGIDDSTGGRDAQICGGAGRHAGRVRDNYAFLLSLSPGRAIDGDTFILG